VTDNVVNLASEQEITDSGLNRIMSLEDAIEEARSFTVEALPCIMILRSFNQSLVVVRCFRSKQSGEVLANDIYHDVKTPGFVAPIDFCIQDNTGFVATLTIT